MSARRTFDDHLARRRSTAHRRATITRMGIRAVFISAKEQRQVAVGQTIFAQGDVGREMFGLIEGRVELRQGDETLVTLEAGDTFGEMAIVSEDPRSLTAVATEPSTLAVIDDRAFLFLVHETPTFALQVMRSMATRIRELDGQRAPGS